MSVYNGILENFANCYDEPNAVRGLRPGQPHVYGILMDCANTSTVYLFERTLKDLDRVMLHFLHDTCRMDPTSNHHALIFTCGGGAVVLIRKENDIICYRWFGNGPIVFPVAWNKAWKIVCRPEDLVPGCKYYTRNFHATAIQMIEESHRHRMNMVFRTPEVDALEKQYATNLLVHIVMTYCQYDIARAIMTGNIVDSQVAPLDEGETPIDEGEDHG